MSNSSALTYGIDYMRNFGDSMNGTADVIGNAVGIDPFIMLIIVIIFFVFIIRSRMNGFVMIVLIFLILFALSRGIF